MVKGNLVRFGMASCIAAFSIIFWSWCASAESSVSVAWKPHSEARSLSKSSGKLQIIHFTAEWCTYCRKMDRETFHDKEVTQYINEHFIACRLDPKKDHELAALFKVKSIPVTWFVKPDAQVITSIPGFVPPSLFLWILKYFDSGSYNSATIPEFLEKNGVSNLMGN